MKTKFIQILSLILAGLLQVAPLLRSFVTNTQGLAPNAWALILKVGVGTAALLEFDSISKASSCSISPPNATVGQFYSGTISYTGSHAGSVSSMSLSNNCMGSPIPFLDGLTIVYSGVNKATVTGTPTNAGTYAFSITSINNANCAAGGFRDTRASTLVIASSGTTPTAPSIVAAPPNTVAQVGTDVQLSGGAAGYPTPQYQWWTSSGTPIPGATNSVLTLTNVQMNTAGVYTMTASNSSTIGDTFFELPKANCYFSVAISGGTNFSAYEYTNYAPAGVPLTMYSFLTNGTSTTTNYYYWVYNSVSTVSTSNTVPFSASLVTPSKAGVYTVYLNSTNAGGGIVISQPYDSYWQFGYLPMFTNSLPASTNVNAGASVTFSVGISGSLNVQNINGGTGGAAYSTNAQPNVFWYQDGTTLVASQTNLLGPTSGTTYSNTAVTSSLTLSGVTAANNGNYTVVVTNLWGSITSSPVALTVVSSSSFAPVITTNPPANISLLAGQNTAMSVTVTGTPPFTFQWRKGGANLANGGVYAGVFTNTLSLTGATTNESGNYIVAITNITGAVTSSIAAVNIALPPYVTPSISSPGMVQLSGSTLTGLTYVVLTETNLASQAWVPIQTNNSGVSGAINFETNTTGGASTFYRLLFP